MVFLSAGKNKKTKTTKNTDSWIAEGLGLLFFLIFFFCVQNLLKHKKKTKKLKKTKKKTKKTKKTDSWIAEGLGLVGLFFYFYFFCFHFFVFLGFWVM